jgi:type IX secretion system PorP/SprF family membrane protein
MTRFKVLIFIVIFYTGICVAQSNIQLNNFWDNANYINPAAINESSYIDLSVAIRKDLLGIPGSASTTFGSFTLFNNEKRSQLGLKLITDHFNYTLSTNATLTYSYSVVIGPDAHLQLGSGLTVRNQSFDIEKVKLSNPNDEFALNELKISTDFDSDIGFQLYTRNYVIGLSGQNIFSVFNPQNDRLILNSNYLYFNYKDDIRSYFNIGYGVCYNFNYYRKSNMGIGQLQINVNGYFKPHPLSNVFQIGIYYRTWRDLGGIIGFDINKKLQLVYSVDFPVNSFIRSSVGTHELMLKYKIPAKNDCRCNW